MPFITISSGLTIKVPTRSTTGWDETLRTDTFAKISSHNHTGSGNGALLTKNAFAADALDFDVIRGDNNEYLTARNAANSADKNILKINASDLVEFGTSITDEGFQLADDGDVTKLLEFELSGSTTGITTTIATSSSSARTLTLPDASDTLVGKATTDTFTNKTFDVDGAGNSLSNVANANIKAAAAIALNKLAAVTANRALLSDGSGFITASSVTNTELGYLSGVTSGIQTQLNTKITASSSDTLTNKTFDADGTGNSITNIENADIKAAAAIDASKLADGTVSNTEFQYINSVTSNVQDQINALSAGAAIQRNHLINGDFETWQVGTAFSPVSSAEYTADMWSFYDSGSTAVVDINRSTTVPTVSQSGWKSNYSLQADVTTADTSIAAGDLVTLKYRMEGKDFREIHQQQVTLSFWVYATQTGTSCVSFRNAADNRSYVAEYTISSSNTWEKKTITLTMDTSGTWVFDNTKALEIDFSLAAGSTYQTTAGSWAAGSYYATSSQINHLGSATNVFHLSQVKLEKSPSATDFRRAGNTEGEEFAMCQRYFQKSYTFNVNPGTSTTVGAFRWLTYGNNINTKQTVFLSTRLRTPGTGTVYSTTGAINNLRDITNGTDRAASVTSGDEGSLTIEHTGSALVGPGTDHGFQWTISARL